MKLKKIDQYTLPNGVRVVILGDVETQGALYAEGIVVWPAGTTSTGDCLKS